MHTPRLILQTVLIAVAAQGCVDLPLFSVVNTGFDEDCDQIAIRWVERTEGGRLFVEEQVKCTQVRANPTAYTQGMRDACDSQPALPLECQGGDVSDGGGQPETVSDSQQDTTLGPDTVDTAQDLVGDSGLAPDVSGTPCSNDADCEVHEDQCNSASCVDDMCEVTPLSGVCDDSDACTSNDTCVAGVCTGTTYSCDSPYACESSTCNGDGTCTIKTLEGSCRLEWEGVVHCYSPGELAGNIGFGCSECLGVVYQDGEPADTGFQPASSGTPCTEPCVTGLCNGSSNTCGAETTETDGTVCDDSNPCTFNDVCAAGSCVGAVVTCSDGVACTVDKCLAGPNGTQECANLYETPGGISVGGFEAFSAFVSQNKYINAGVTGAGMFLAENIPFDQQLAGFLGELAPTSRIGQGSTRVLLFDDSLMQLDVLELGLDGHETRLEAVKAGGRLVLAGSGPSELDFNPNQTPAAYPGDSGFLVAYSTLNGTFEPQWGLRHEPWTQQKLHVSSTIQVAARTGMSPSLSGGGVTAELPELSSSHNIIVLGLDLEGTPGTMFPAVTSDDPNLSVSGYAFDTSTQQHYLTFDYSAPVTVGAGVQAATAPSPAGTDMAIAKFFANGDLAWVKWFEGGGTDEGSGLIWSLGGLVFAGSAVNVAGPPEIGIDGLSLSSATPGRLRFTGRMDTADGAVSWMAKYPGSGPLRIAEDAFLAITAGANDSNTKAYELSDGSSTQYSIGAGAAFVAELGADGAQTRVWELEANGKVRDLKWVDTGQLLLVSDPIISDELGLVGSTQPTGLQPATYYSAMWLTADALCL